jgi:hypothetical protein
MYNMVAVAEIKQAVVVGKGTVVGGVCLLLVLGREPVGQMRELVYKRVWVAVAAAAAVVPWKGA